MKLTYKRFWILLLSIIIISCNSNSIRINADSNIEVAQAVFSVEKISKEEFIQAESTSAEYNIYPQQVDSIAQYDVLNRIFQDAREHIAHLDSIDKSVIYLTVTDDELYCVDNLIYYPDLKLLGFMVPMDFNNNTIWWYDSTTGKPTVKTDFKPVAVSKNGIYVCQALRDCDIMLDLHFFKKKDNLIYEIQAYKNQYYSGEYYLLLSEEEQLKSIFWQKNNVLYLCSYDYSINEVTYLKISLN